MQNKPTPTPWEYDQNISQIVNDKGQTICAINIGLKSNAANAQFIVKAVNCHDELVEALKEAKNMIHANSFHDLGLEKIEQALAKAGESC